MLCFLCAIYGNKIKNDNDKKNQGVKIMATVIRLARYGAKKRPYYHVVVTDSRNARNSGNVLETVGKYNPMLAKTDEKRVVLNIERIKDWMSKGAKPSDRVYKFLANAGVVAARPVPNQTKKNQPSEKTQMKAKDKAEKLAKIAEEKANAEAAAKAAAEAPAETPAEEATTTEEA
jgi:small subunit ribosomal protein S16